MTERTNREVAEWIASNTRLKGGTRMVLVGDITHALDAAHRRGVLEGRIAELEKWRESADLPTSLDMHARLKELRAELEKTT